jgi:hypothetical protein
VTANFFGDARRRGALADHPPRIRLAHRFLGQHRTVMTATGAE